MTARMKIPDFANCFDKVKRQPKKDSGLYHATLENGNLIKEFGFGKFFMIARMKIPFIVLTRSNAYKMSNNITLLYTAIYRLGDQKPIHWTFLVFKILQNNTSLY